MGAVAEEHVLEVFKAFDLDSDGTLERGEFIRRAPSFISEELAALGT